MPTRRRNSESSTERMFWLSSRISPSARVLRTVSFMRLSVRRKVDFPQPDGPMNAVTWLVWILISMSCKRLELPVEEVHLRRPPVSGRRRPEHGTNFGLPGFSNLLTGLDGAMFIYLRRMTSLGENHARTHIDQQN